MVASTFLTSQLQKGPQYRCDFATSVTSYLQHHRHTKLAMSIEGFDIRNKYELKRKEIKNKEFLRLFL